MTVNYAEKYSSQVDERFAQGSLSTAFVNDNYDFLGVETVKVYQVNTSELNDYTTTGMQRFGTPEELGNVVQEMKLGQDKSFTFTIDSKSAEGTEGAMEAGQALNRQILEKIIPAVDKHRFAKIVAGAETDHIGTGAITKTNAYASILDGIAKLQDEDVPLEGLVLGVTPTVYKFLKQDDSFIKNSDLGQTITINGQVGAVDGVPVVLLPAKRLPENVEFIIAHNSVTPSPVKLSLYRVLDQVAGLDGSLVEGRIHYDAFVLDGKKKGIYVHKKA
jgi:hypothetical protein|nr:MAG TPA: major capsid protein [Caudoviricetes sp.]DAM50947.1 MAG TPA: major capsid protein [Caudoviricetes sp.]